MKDILLVEDQLELAELIKLFLERDGYGVHHVSSGEEALDYLTRHRIKLMLLDIMLPGMDGFAVCRRVREQENTPILMMSARTGKDNQLNGFQLGADDYMEKPVDPDILAAKIRALMQRSYGTEVKRDMLVSGQLTIDLNGRQLYKNKNLIALNVKEYELLHLLVQNSGKTLSKEFLFNTIWGADSFSENQMLTVHIKMLRKKIEENPKQPKRIKTVWGVGYRYEEI